MTSPLQKTNANRTSPEVLSDTTQLLAESCSSVPSIANVTGTRTQQGKAYFMSWREEQQPEPVKTPEPDQLENVPGMASSAHDFSREKFDTLLEQHRGRIMLFIISLVQNVADAEDLCQKCSVIMWQKIAEFDQSKSFLAWACGIARLEAFNHRRSRAAERLCFESDVVQLLTSSLEELPEENQEQRLAALKKCIHSLPEQEQDFLRQIYWEGSSFDAIARDLGCSPRTFYNRMYLLRRRLSRCVLRRLSSDR